MTSRPRLSLTIAGLRRLFGADLRAVVDTARAAEDAGFDQVVLPDHVVMGADTSAYPFGTFPYRPDEPWLEPLTTLAAMASVTDRIRLATGILIAPLRPAPLLAKTAATLDVLSGGRVDLGVGSGWQEVEFTASGISFAERERRLDDTIRACVALWRDTPASYHGGSMAIGEVWCEPRPTAGTIPLWFAGGPTARTARRVAELGAGWLPIAGTPITDIAAGHRLLNDACHELQRDPTTVGIRAGLPAALAADGRPDVGATLDTVDELVAIGVTTLSVTLPRWAATAADVGAALETLGDAWAERFGPPV